MFTYLLRRTHDPAASRETVPRPPRPELCRDRALLFLAMNYAEGSSSKEEEALTLFPAFFCLKAPVMV